MPFVAGGCWEDRPRVGCDRCVSTCWDGPIGAHMKSCGCPCLAAGCKHAASWDIQDRATQGQRFIRQLREYHGCVVVPRTRAHFRWIARWWEIEASRGYESSERSREYAANYRWLVELMDAGHQITADAHGVYVDGELASAYVDRGRRAAKRAARQSAC